MENKEMRKLPKQLAEIEKDCLKLEKKNDLTEFGEGELSVINIVKKHIKQNKDVAIIRLCFMWSSKRL